MAYFPMFLVNREEVSSFASVQLGKDSAITQQPSAVRLSSTQEIDQTSCEWRDMSVGALKCAETSVGGYYYPRTQHFSPYCEFAFRNF